MKNRSSICFKLSRTIEKNIATLVHQWHSTNDVIEWFKSIPDKNICTFIQYDIDEFYPSISKQLLQESLRHAKQFTKIPDNSIEIIYHSRKTLLFSGNNMWIKKSGDSNFDVTMGSFDGAELCELVGLFILYTIANEYGLNTAGLYRDDGLCCFHNISGPQSEKIKKNLINIFKDKFNLKITIRTNLKVVNFLDVTLNLADNSFQPYRKPGDSPLYINIDSNHPPNIIKSIPKMISNRINNISSSKESFDRAAPFYNNALNSCGFKDRIAFIQNIPKSNARSRKRNIIWFNPPYSLNVRTNVAKLFLNLIDKCFPKGHKLHKLFNRNNLKVSYSCLPSIKKIITSHNKNILSNTPDYTNQLCNCRQSTLCPLNGKCLRTNLIYICNIKTHQQEKGHYYIGLTEKTFKDRWYKHKNSFLYESKANSTELSKFVWECKRKGSEPILTWSILDQAEPFKPGGKSCNLCLTEKYHIITSELNLLNKRSELTSKCRHENKFLIKNFVTIEDIHSIFFVYIFCHYDFTVYNI